MWFEKTESSIVRQSARMMRVNGERFGVCSRSAVPLTRRLSGMRKPFAWITIDNEHASGEHTVQGKLQCWRVFATGSG